MTNVTIGLGVVLLALGLGSYFGSGRTSVTALIPAFFGLPLLALGWLALQLAIHFQGHQLHEFAVVIPGTVHHVVEMGGRTDACDIEVHRDGW